MKKATHFSAIALFLLLSATGCGNSKTEIQTTEPTKPTKQTETAMETETIPETVPETEPATEPPSGVNPLTGEGGYPDGAVNRRPIAVMVNNLKQSYPQYGTSGADVLYEVPVEGGVTRMMAVYANPDTVPDVGSVRSARYYFPKIAQGMDAIYCHWGMEQEHAKATLQELNIDSFDGGKLENSLLFYRDPERVGKYSSEHTGYLRGSDILRAIESSGFRTDRINPDMAFLFSDSPRMPSEAACVRAELSFSDSSVSAFVYDAATQNYLMYHGDAPQMDGKAEAQLSFTNVFALRTQTAYLDDANYLRSISLEGGSGYYISMGGMETIRWEKTADDAPFRYYTLDGAELSVNAGKSYIGILDECRPIRVLAE